jgi:predicted O-methyltransferase YrrM
MTRLSKVLNPRRHYYFWRGRYQQLHKRARDFGYLRRTNAPPEVMRQYLRGPGDISRYVEMQRSFRELASSLRLSNDWFTDNIPYWLAAFDEVGLAERRETKVLEIGSWEGLSSFFILHTIPHSILTCVDTWEGADEHRSGDFATPGVLSSIERTFDHNLARFSDRLVKHKGPSFGFYQQRSTRDPYDLIYVDGSHHSDDVLVDAIKCFEMLKLGGLMIFDDYLWKYYPRAIDNPAAAINLFLRLKKGSYRIVRLYYQMIIQKTGMDAHRANPDSALQRS